ncbi:DUF3150 domain-containing protein [Vibrio mediterranei]
MLNDFGQGLKKQGLALIEVKITGSDFKKALDPNDLGLKKNITPELATLGRKCVFDKKFPKLLRNNKDQTYVYLNKMGISFGPFGCWAVPVHLYEEVVEWLEGKKAEREVIKQEMLNRYDELLEDFAQKAESLQEGFGDIVRKNAYSESHIEHQIGFYINVQDDILNGISLNAVKGLSQMAKDYEKEIFKAAKASGSAPNITRFTRTKLQDMREYCLRFMFLTNVLNHASTLIDSTIAALPATIVRGEKYPEETSEVLTTLKLLENPDELEGIVLDSDSSTAIDLADDLNYDDDQTSYSEEDEISTNEPDGFEDDAIGENTDIRTQAIGNYHDDWDMDSFLSPDEEDESGVESEMPAFDPNVDEQYDCIF